MSLSSCLKNGKAGLGKEADIRKSAFSWRRMPYSFNNPAHRIRLRRFTRLARTGYGEVDG